MIARLGTGLLLALALEAVVFCPAQASPDHRNHGGLHTRANMAYGHHAPPSPLPAPRPALWPGQGIAAPTLRTATVIRPIIATYVPRTVVTTPRVVSVTAPYYVIVGPGYTGTSLAYPADTNWNWTPVESVAALAGRSDLRYFCPDTRSYYPETEACPSPWLKVVP